MGRDRRGGPPQGGPGGSSEFRPTQQDQQYLSRPFFKNKEDEEQGLPDSAWLDEIPKHFGKRFKDAELSDSQIRNFYQEARRIWEMVGPPISDKSEETKRVRRGIVQLKLLAAKASYHAGRRESKVPSVFKEYLVQCIAKVNTRQQFHAFMLVFEATTGYFVYFRGGGN